MLARIKQRKFWAAVLALFGFFFIVNLGVDLLIRDKSETLLLHEAISTNLGSSLMMAVILVLITRPSQPVVEQRNTDDFRYYATFFLWLSGIACSIALVLLSLVYVTTAVFYDQAVSARNVFLKPLAVMLVMALIITLVAWLAERFRPRAQA